MRSVGARVESGPDLLRWGHDLLRSIAISVGLIIFLGEKTPMTFQPPYRPSGRSVWLGKDLVQTEDWIVRLSPATLEEIDASVSRFRGHNAYDTPVTRDEFPLTTMADELARMRREIAIGRGFFVFRGLDRDRYP